MCFRVHSIRILGGFDIFQAINSKMDQLGITGVDSRDIVNIYEDYIGLGFSLNRPQELGTLH